MAAEYHRIDLNSTSVDNVSAQSNTISIKLNQQADYTNTPDKKWMVALSRLSVYNSFQNISAALGNNTFSYTNTLATARLVTIPDGTYTVADLNDYIHQVITNNGDGPVSGVYGLNFYANTTQYRVSIEIFQSFSVLFGSALAATLGIVPGVYAASFTGTLVPDLNNGVNNLQVKTNVVSQSFLRTTGQSVIYSFVPKAQPAELIDERINPLIWLPVQNSRYGTIDVSLVDQNGRPITIIDSWSAVLVFTQIKI